MPLSFFISVKEHMDEWFFKLEVYAIEKLIPDKEKPVSITRNVLIDLDKTILLTDERLLRSDLFEKLRLDNPDFDDNEINSIVDAKLNDAKKNPFYGFLQLIRFIIIHDETEVRTISTGAMYLQYDGNIDWLYNYFITETAYKILLDRPRLLTEDEIKNISSNIFYIMNYGEQEDEVKDDFKGSTENETIKNIKNYLKTKKIKLDANALVDIANTLKSNKKEYEHIFKTKTDKTPVIQGGTLKVREYATELAIKWISEELRGVQIASHSIEELINLGKNDVKSSNGQPGTAVGILVGESLGSLNTQATLNSVDWEEKVFIKTDDKIILTSIGEFIDNIIDNSDDVLYDLNESEWVDVRKHNFLVISVDEDGILNWKKLEGVTRHLPDGLLIKIKTKSGREARVTRNESLLTEKNHKIVPIRGDEIKVGDFVPIMANLPFSTELTKMDGFDLDLDFGFFMKTYIREGKILNKQAVHLPYHKSLKPIYDKYPHLCDGKFIVLMSYELVTFLETHFKNKTLPPWLLIAHESFLFNFIHFDTKDIMMSELTTTFGILCDINDTIKVHPSYAEEGHLYFETEKRKNISRKYKGDIFLDEVEFISETPSSHSKVYDFTVADTRNFTLFGGLCVRDSFHSSGQDTSSTMSTNVLSDVISSSKNPPQVITSVAFKNKRLTYQEVYRLRSQLVNITYNDLLINNSRDAIEIEMLKELGGAQWWHNYYYDDIDEDEYILRLHFDVNKLYASNIDLEDLTEEIEIMSKVKIKDIIGASERSLEYIRVIRSPTHVGIIDIYPERSKITSILSAALECSEKDPTGCILIFLKIILLVPLKSRTVRGIPGILEIYPQVETVAQLILMEKNINDVSIKQIKLPKFDKKNATNIWVIYLNKNRIRMTGIKPTNLSYLFSLVGIESLGINEEEGYMVIYHKFSKKPSEYLLEKVQADKQKSREDVKRKRNEGIRGYIKTERTELMKASEYVYAVLRGDRGSHTLAEIMSLGFVDQNHTYSSNAHELTELLGIEAAYNLLYNTLSVASEAVGGSNKRHLDLVSQVITRWGKPQGLRTPSIRTASGFLSRATFSRASTVLASQAIMGGRESMLNPSAAIAIGQIAKIGTGFRGDKFVDDQFTEEFLNEEEKDEGDLEIQEFFNFNPSENPEERAAATAAEIMTIPLVTLAGKLPDIKENKAVDDIPIFRATRPHNLNYMLSDIEIFLEANSGFKFNIVKVEEKEIKLSSIEIQQLLKGAVVSGVGYGSIDPVNGVLNDLNSINEIADMFS